LVSEIISAI